MRRMHFIRVFSESTIDRSTVIYPEVAIDSYRVIPEGNYVNWYPPKESQQSAKNKLGLKEQKTTLLYFGGIRPYKGITGLIKAFGNSNELKDVQLIVAGKPFNQAYMQMISQLASGSRDVHIHAKFIADKDVGTYFSAADVVVFPFQAVENSGSVILAMGYGKPVVAPDMGVVSTRLNRQKQLLYSGDLQSALERAVRLKGDTLADIGKSNSLEASRFVWKDFGRAFLK